MRPLTLIREFFMPTSPTDLKRQVQQETETLRDLLLHISHTIHANPELAFREYKATALLTETLAQHGFDVERGSGGLETAFTATYQKHDGGPTIALLSEYDALPDIGHACGHNIIATAPIGAALVLRPLLEQFPGTLKIIGTPAEEYGGGKIKMLRAGAFENIDVAMMIHPSTRHTTHRGSLAFNSLTFEFHGKAAHAAASPHRGINALDAIIMTFNNINALRQQVREDVRIHGIITDGGVAANIIPDYTRARFIVRANEVGYLSRVTEKVIDCARGAALATGAELKADSRKGYANMMSNEVLANLYADNLSAMDVTIEMPDPSEPMGSTDMGNVSQVIPSIHPYVAIAPRGVAGHSVEMREAARSPQGDEGLMLSAKALAMTVVDLLAQPELVRHAQDAFQRTVATP
jgi:amidohydrolase